MSYESGKHCTRDLYAKIQQLFMNLYAGIAMDVKKINYYL
jgi:hypothetical protein